MPTLVLVVVCVSIVSVGGGFSEDVWEEVWEETDPQIVNDVNGSPTLLLPPS